LRTRASCPSDEAFLRRRGESGDVGDADDVSNAEALGVGTATSWSSGHCGARVFGLGVFSPAVFDLELPLIRKFEGYFFDRNLVVMDGVGDI